MPYAEFGAYKVSWESTEDEEGREVTITGPFPKGEMVLDELEADELVDALKSFIDDWGIWFEVREEDD